MRSMLAMTIGLFVLTCVSAASARETLALTVCPKGYAPLVAVCISATNGDIVLPTSNTGSAPSQTRTGG